jgi:DNA polymerase I
MSKKALLVDSSYLIFRSYYAYPHLSNKEVPTGALFGFVKTIYKLVQDFGIDYVFFAQDLPKPTWRHKEYEGYKAGRKEPDEAMIKQFPLVYEWCELFSPKALLSQEGYEADDVIFSLAADLEKKVEIEKVYVFSSDRDLYQILNHPKICFIHNDQLFDKAKFEEKYGVKVEQWVDYKTLTGDSSDNLQGVPGVGPKTAAKILQEIGSLDKVMETLKKGYSEELLTKTEQKLLDQMQPVAEQVQVTRRLAQLHLMPELQYDFKPLQLQAGLDREFLQKYNFKSLIKASTTPPASAKTMPVQESRSEALF